jgi:hypothetical protein
VWFVPGGRFLTPKDVEVLCDVEHLKGATHSDAESDRHGQFQQFGVGEVGAQATPEFVVDSRVIDRKSFGVFGGQSFAIGEVRVIVIVLNRVVRLVIEPLPHRRCGSCVHSNDALIELCYPHSGDLAFANRQTRLDVDGLAHGRHARTHVGSQLPQTMGFEAVSIGDIESGHVVSFLSD